MGMNGLHGELVERLGRMIVSAAMTNEELPSVGEMEAEYGVSRSVVREVLRVLEAKGLVSSRPRIGLRIRPETEWHYLDPDVVRWRAAGTASTIQLQEMAELRMATEPLAARLAATQPATVTFEGLSRSVAEMTAAASAGSYQAFVAADREFHRALLRGSGNRMLTALGSTLSAALQVRSEVISMSEDMSANVLELHAAVLRAIEQRDPQGAEEAARAIVQAGLQEVEHALHRSRGFGN
jgi:DNA-binding FadR family transcriptional regulator